MTNNNNNFNLVINACKELLNTFPSAVPYKSYLNNRLSETISNKFDFGYFPDQANLGILLEAIGEERLAELNLIYDVVRDNNKERHGSLEKHNLIFPFKDLYGNIIALGGRSILSDEERSLFSIPKYKNTAFLKGEHLFGLFEARKSILKNDIVYVVEGQFDCVKAHQHDIENVVALGGSNMSFIQLSLLKRYTNNIALMLDSDDAGKSGTEKALNYYSKYANITKRDYPNGYKDLDEFLSAGNKIQELNLQKI